MLFSRDAVAAKLQQLGHSAGERRQTLSAVTLVNLVLGAAFFLATVFTSSVWGSAIGFQATSTAVAQLVLNAIVLQWIRQPDLQKLDVIGGAFLMLLLMLLQTTLAWRSFSSGFIGNTMPIPCFIGGSGGDHAVSILSGMLLFTNAVLAGLAAVWKSDWTESGNNVHYSSLSGTVAESRMAETSGSKSSNATKPSKDGAFLDEDVEGGL